MQLSPLVNAQVWDVEFAFTGERGWRFDFAFTESRIAVEVEGGTWSRGRHVRGSGFDEDCEKYAEAMIAGWTVLRVTAEMVHDGRAITFLERLLTATQAR